MPSHPPIPPIAPAAPTLHWTESDQARSARWRSERGAPPPKKVVLADDTMTADAAYRLACEGTAMLWRGDFQNARQLLQALGRRADQSIHTDKRGRPLKPAVAAQNATKSIAVRARSTGATGQNALELDDAQAAAAGFHRHRQAQAQRARVLGMVLLPFDVDYAIPLRRAPDARQACAEAWGPAESLDPATQSGEGEGSGRSVASLRELLGLISAHEWRKKGVEVPALGAAPHNRIYPHYGVFSPLRGEYVGLVAQAPLPHAPMGQGAPAGPGGLTAFDIGTGTGVLSAVLARRGVARVLATDMDPRALACAHDNLVRLGVVGLAGSQVEIIQANLFPPAEAGLANVIVCNPPWLPARPSSPIEHAVYDEGSGMLLGFLKGLAVHLAPGGEGWLILSDLAEHLGLRTRAELLEAIAAAGLQVVGRLDTRPVHGKAVDASDPLHAARSVEVTSLWRLAPVGKE